MYHKVITSLLTLSLIVSLGLAAKDPSYIPLAGTVVGGITVISELMKTERKQLPSTKDDKSE